MKVNRMNWSRQQGWKGLPTSPVTGEALVCVFAGTEVLESGAALQSLRNAYPDARFVGCSTAGEIRDTTIADDSLVATVARFDHTTLRSAQAVIDRPEASAEAGTALAKSLDRPGLRHVFVISDGLKANGSALVRGLTANLPPDVLVTGGLAGDGARFGRTYVVGDEGARAGAVAAVGFYGERIRVGHGSLGGWDPFGPERLITKANGNVLYELDGQSALALYKQYLGSHAAGLPSSALLFPLAVRLPDGQGDLVRTVLGIDEAAQSMTFAGDMPAGSRARMMKANFDRLIDGAAGAATSALAPCKGAWPSMAILISCVGRRLVLKQRTEEEIESVRDILGPRAVLTGFYSYGEISPLMPVARCELHNQTMTITTLSETDA